MKKIKNRGFTVVELLVVVVILGVAGSVALPNVMSYMEAYRLRSASRELYGNMQLARISAIKAREDCYIAFNTPVTNKYQVYFNSKVLKTVNLRKHDKALSFSAAPEKVYFQANGMANGEADITVSNPDSNYTASVFFSGAIKLQQGD